MHLCAGNAIPGMYWTVNITQGRKHVPQLENIHLIATLNLIKMGPPNGFKDASTPSPQLIKTVQRTRTIKLWTAIATGTNAMALVGTPCQLISLPQFQTILPPPNVQPSLQRPPAMLMNSWEKLTTLSYFSWVWRSTSTFSYKGIVNAVYSG